MKVSIIVPVYNSEKYLSKCLNSIITSTYQDLEVIVVNDGSTDNSLNILRSFMHKDKRIHIFSQQNLGQSVARARGVKESTGDYIWFVDSDDWIAPESIEYCLKYMNCGNDVIMFGFYRYYGKSTKPSALMDENIELTGVAKENFIRKLIGPIGTELRRPYSFNDLNFIWNKIFKRNVINNVDFLSNKEKRGEDLLTVLQAFNYADSITYIDKFLYYYNKENENSVTSVYDKKDFKLSKTLFIKLYNYICGKLDKEKCFEALKNREVVSMLGFVRNIVRSDLTRSKKYEELQKIFDDKEYMKAFESFDYSYLPLIWRIFYKSAAKKRTGIVLLMGEAMEQARKILYYK